MRTKYSVLKNILTVVTALVFGLSLCGCSMATESYTDSNMNFDQYGDGYPHIAEGADGYYYLNNGEIWFYDSDTEETALFCDGFESIDYLGYYDNAPYAIGDGALYSLSDNEREKLFDIHEAENLSDKQFTIHSGYLVVCGLSDNGNSEVMLYTLESGECETIYELAGASYVRISPYSDVLYVLSGDDELTELCGYDLTSGETNMLYNSGSCVFSSPFFRVTAEAAYISESGAVYAYNVTSGAIAMSFDFNSDNSTAYEIGGFAEYYAFAGYSDGSAYHLYVKDIYGNDKIVTDIALSDEIEAVICGCDSQRVFVWVNPDSDDSSVIAVNFLNGDFQTLW